MSSRIWIRLLLAVVALQILGALAGAAMGGARALPNFADLPFPPTFYLVPLLVLATVGCLLLVLGREDPRAVDLGIFFLLLSCPFTNRWLLTLVKTTSPTAVSSIALLLRSLQVDALFPYFFWRFTRGFPQAPTSPKLQRVIALGMSASLILGAALAVFQFGVLVWSLRINAGPAFAPFLAAPDKPSFSFYGPLLLFVMLGLAVLLWRARKSTGVERRRVSLFAGGLIFGVAPLFVQLFLGLVFRSYREYQERPEVVPIFSAVIFACFLSIPFITTYAVLVHHVLDVKLIARRALHYALARFSAMVLATVPLLALLSYLYYHRDEPLRELFSGNRLLLLLSASAVGWLALRYRGALLEAVDRRFFREQYDARQILTLLVERIRATSDVVSLAGLLAREIDLALHLEGISLLVHNPSSGMLSDPKKRAHRLDSSSPLVDLVSGSSEPLATELEDPRSAVAKLPEKDRHWLVDSGFKLMVPIVARDGSLQGILGLGAKKSGLPFLREDRQLLHAVASSAGWVLELAQLHSTGPRRASRGADLEEIGSTLPAADLAKECGNCERLYPPYTVFCNQCSRRLEPSHVPYVLPGKFRFECRIGSGGMGVVYRGVDLALGRAVAVKTLRRVSPEDAMRLRREARTAAAVSHRHLAPVYGMETWQGTPMLVLELLEGGTLAQRLEKGKLSPLETVELGIAMADALAQLHASDILHRDIKPSNIGYTRDGIPKLMDFGIARVAFDLRRDQPLGSFAAEDDFLPPTGVWNQNPSSISLSKQLVGTLSYLSPEALNGETPDASFDLWSLSIVLYECLLGRKVFSGADAKQIMSRIKLGRVPEPAQVLPDCDEALGELFRLALHKTPSRRPFTALELKQRLEAVRDRLRLAPLPDPPPQSGRGRPHPDPSLRSG